MSRNIKNALGTSKAKAAIAVVGGAAVLGLLFSGASGADFTASGKGNVSVSTGTLNIALSDGKNSSGTFDLQYPNLSPGKSQQQLIKIRNTGSIPATVAITGLGTPTISDAGKLNPGSADQLKVKIGADAEVSAPSLVSAISYNLGELPAGGYMEVPIAVSLDQEAGNDWQNQKISVTGVTVTLKGK